MPPAGSHSVLTQALRPGRNQPGQPQLPLGASPQPHTMEVHVGLCQARRNHQVSSEQAQSFHRASGSCSDSQQVPSQEARTKTRSCSPRITPGSGEGTSWCQRILADVVSVLGQILPYSHPVSNTRNTTTCSAGSVPAGHPHKQSSSLCQREGNGQDQKIRRPSVLFFPA